MRAAIVWTAVVVAVLGLTAMVVYAERGQGPKSDEKAQMPRHMMDEVKLTEQQLEKIAALRVETQKKVIPLRSEIQLAQLELRTALDKDPVDTKAVHDQIEAIGRLKTQMRILQVDMRIQARNLLTPEQRSKAKGWMFGLGHGPWGGEGREGGFPREGRGPRGSDCPMF